MNKITRNIDLFFTLLLLHLFCNFSFLFYNDSKGGTTDFILTGALFGVILLSYFRGTVWGLLTCAFIIFSYATYALYGSFVAGREVSTSTYFWTVSIPIGAFISGKLSEYVSTLQKANIDMQRDYIDLVTVDKLTGLNNLKKFYEDLDKCISVNKRHGIPLTLMIIKFEYYDSIRTLIGDEKMEVLLKAVSDCISSALRNEDEKYILTKDLMAVIMSNTDKKGSKIVKERIKVTLKELNLKEKLENKKISLDFKIGVLQYDELFKNAFEFRELAEKELEYDV